MAGSLALLACPARRTTPGDGAAAVERRRPRKDVAAMRIHDVASARRVRAALIDHIWRGRGFPAPRAVRVRAIGGAQLPVALAHDLARVEQLEIEQPLVAREGGGVLTAVAYHLVPRRARRRLVVLHQGHAHLFADLSGELALRALLDRRHPVLLLYMPLRWPNSGPAHLRTHDDLMGLASPARCPIQLFLEPVALALAHLRRVHGYLRETAMVGISGGGWTTQLYAAVDPTITTSIAVAGSLPLDLRTWGYDGEQGHPALYEGIAGYRDLYVLGAAGVGRSQIQVLNRDEKCCFGGTAYRGYERAVRAMARRLGGDLSVYLDTSQAKHVISEHALRAVILPRLEGDRARLLDDGDVGFGYPGSPHGSFSVGSAWRPLKVGFGGGARIARGGTAAPARYRFRDLAAGRYRVSITWPADGRLATDVRITVSSGGKVLVERRVDQRRPPADRRAHGARWIDVGQPVVVGADGALEVRISGSKPSMAFVVADAVRIERLAGGR